MTKSNRKVNTAKHSTGLALSMELLEKIKASATTPIPTKRQSFNRYQYNRRMAAKARQEMIDLGIITPVA